MICTAQSLRPKISLATTGKRFKSYLNGIIRINLYKRMAFLKSKRPADKISFEDESEMRFDVETCYNKVNKVLNK